MDLMKLIIGIVLMLFAFSLWQGPAWFRKTKFTLIPIRFGQAKPGFNSLEDVYDEKGSMFASKLFSILIFIIAILIIISSFFKL